MPGGRDVVFTIIGRDAASPALLKGAASADKMTAAVNRTMAAAERTRAMGATLTRHVSLPLLAIGAVAVKASTDFNSTMTRIQTQAGASAKDVTFLSKAVLSMQGAQQGPNELAKALYHLKSVGLGNVPAMKALRQASDLAAVGHANLEETTNALAGAWRTGIKGAGDFTQAAATVNATIGAGNMSLEDFNAALGTGILPTAKTFGLTMKDVGASLALFTDEGVPADSAATRLRMTMALLGAPTKQASKILKDMGFSAAEAGKRTSGMEALLKKSGVSTTTLATDMRKPNGLLVAVQDLSTHLKHSGLTASEQASALSRAFGGGRSSSAILSMVNNVDVLGQKYRQVGKSIKKFGEDVAAQAATPEAKFKRFRAELDKAGIELGDELLPLATKFVGKFTGIAKQFNGLSSETKKIIGGIGVGLIVLGPAMSILGRLGTAFGGLVKLQTKVQTALRGTTTVAASQAEAQNVIAQQNAAAVAESEALKARATAESATARAKSLQGTDSMLAADSRAAATDAEAYALAMETRANAAIASAAKITAAFETETAAAATSTRAAGLGGPVGAGGARAGVGGVRGFLGGGGGLALGMGGMIAGQAVGGTAGSALTGMGTGAMLGSFFGPEGTIAGAAIGGVTSLIMKGVGAWNDHKAAAKAAAQAEAAYVDQLSSAIAADNGAISEHTRLMQIANLSKGPNNVLDQATNLHISTNDVVNASMGNGAGLQRDIVGQATRLQAEGNANNAKIAELAKKPNTDAVQKEIKALEARNAAITTYWNKLQKLQTTLGQMGIDVRKGVKEWNQQFNAVNSNRGAVGNFTTQLGRLRKGLETAENVDGSFMQSLQGSGAAATHNRGVLTSLAGAAVADARATFDAARKHMGYKAALAAANTTLQKHVAQIEAAAVAAGFNKSQVDKLITSMFGLGKQHPKPTVSINDHATPTLHDILNNISAVKDKTVTVTVKADTPGNLQGEFNQQVPYAARHATGGDITGAGTGTSDSILSKLSNGEFVVRATQAKKYHGLLENINKGVQGFSVGGAVGNARQISSALSSSFGLTRNQIAGFLGNFQIESSLNPRAYNARENAHGFAQWEGGRWTALQQYARQIGASATSSRAEVGFLVRELRHSPGLISHIKGMRDPGNIAAYIDANYERSSGSSRAARMAAARQFARSGVGVAGGGPNVGRITTGWRMVGHGKKRKKQEYWEFGGQKYSTRQAAENAQARAQKSANQKAVDATKQLASAFNTVRGAISGSVADMRGALGALTKDFKTAGASSRMLTRLGRQEARVMTNQAKLVAARNTLGNITQYNDTVRGALTSNFDYSKYGSVTDMISGFQGQTGQNNKYTNMVNVLRRRAGKNSSELGLVNSLAAQGDSTSLESLFGASGGEFSNAGKAYSSYNKSVQSGVDAAAIARYGATAAQEQRRVDRLTTNSERLLQGVAQLAETLSRAEHTRTGDASLKNFERIFHQLEVEIRHGGS